MTKMSRSPDKYFQLRPLQAAKVSAISETTANANISPDQKVNFHIGHPVFDLDLVNYYCHLVTGLSGSQKADSALEDSPWGNEQKEQIDLIRQAVEQSTQYMPRGGYASTNPHRVAQLIQSWFESGQREGLHYGLGEESEPREIIFSSGGLYENLRVLFHALSRTLVHQPAYMVTDTLRLPEYLQNFPALEFPDPVPNAQDLFAFLKEHLQENDSNPHYLILGTIPSEDIRRKLRRLALEFPLFFVEVNNALNHLSLAREAGMQETVLRYISPGIFLPGLHNFPITIVAGNAQLIEIFETVHFQLKGTPSAADMELLSYLMEKIPNDFPAMDSEQPADFALNVQPQTSKPFNPVTSGFVKRVEQIANDRAHIVESVANFAEKKFKNITDLFDKRIPGSISLSDPLIGMDRHEIADSIINPVSASVSVDDLSRGLLSHFIRHHPEYDAQNLLTVSGSARTALSLLGFHCKIKEVVVPDLSWTYEHCFPDVTAVPLDDDLSLDDKGIIETVRKKMETQSGWESYGAVVLNNPHNASGQVFHQQKLRRILQWLLQHNITVIDDLAYENVRPDDSLGGPMTLQQMGKDLLKTGGLRQAHLRHLITVHSLSKTDCFAGARVAVVHLPQSGRFRQLTNMCKNIAPNRFSLLLAYLFYRNHTDQVQRFWQQRNRRLQDRMQALEAAEKALPAERNPYNIHIQRPQGAMYPHLIIEGLPEGLSLDWIGVGLATRGIGLVPLTTFARTASGFDLARKRFRLTLGGSDSADILQRKTRRMLIDLNRLLDEESAKYSREKLPQIHGRPSETRYFHEAGHQWNKIIAQVETSAREKFSRLFSRFASDLDSGDYFEDFTETFLPFRLEVLQQRFSDHRTSAESVLAQAGGRKKAAILEKLETELSGFSLESKEQQFRQRLFDRTVHPTQMYALKVDIQANAVMHDILYDRRISKTRMHQLSEEIIHEYLGTNIPIESREEMDELVADLHLMIRTEDYTLQQRGKNMPLLLSFWGDWDGSTRPSGQGHRLVAAAVLENVTMLSNIVEQLHDYDSDFILEPGLWDEIREFPGRKRKFLDLLNDITSLTNQLEKRYQRVLPFGVKPGRLKKIGMKLRLVKDPLRALWQHNDRLERKMVKLRNQRRENLEDYFQLNQRLREALRAHLETLGNYLNIPDIALQLGTYHSLLDRFVLTPRIHQKMILAQDQFAIDTTVHNITEINEIAAKYRSPGLVLALQISMSDNPEAFIMLERKLRARREEIVRDHPDLAIPHIKVVPLFEDVETVHNLESYLDRIWEYAEQTRGIEQTPEERFREMVCELFVAGSDLSQQMSQVTGAELYKEAKHRTYRWLTDHGLIGNVRMKLGSGEPMQRQGGYYDAKAGIPSASRTGKNDTTLNTHLTEASQRSLQYARSPLRGVWSGGEFRTFQSNVFEQLRLLPSDDRAELFHHIALTQQKYEQKIIRASEPLVNTRLEFRERGTKDLAMIARGPQHEIFQKFTAMVTSNFRQILYGRSEDVVGMHIISYFIARTTPALRDRPVVRPGKNSDEGRGQEIVQRIAQTLPLSRHGSLLRAIGHNRSQTMVLGVNQLTTGLFRSFRQLLESHHLGTNGLSQIQNHILPHLPVYDILHTLRIYHDPELDYVQQMIPLFPASNSALSALQEDNTAVRKFIPLLQKELLRRQGLDPEEFFTKGAFKTDLLPQFRPDLAVLLQPNLFHGELSEMIGSRKFSASNSSPWEKTVGALLEKPRKINIWRQKIWELIGSPIREQVERFVELAMALQTLTSHENLQDMPFTSDPAQALRLGTQVTDLLREVQDDTMRQFLVAAVKYLTQIPENLSEVPVDVIRALRDVERLVKIEEQALNVREQALLRFYLLQMARIAGENG